MDAIVAERGQITLPKEVRDALGLTKGTRLLVELHGGTVVIRKNVSAAVERVYGILKLPDGMSTDDVMRELRGRAPGDPIEPGELREDAATAQLRDIAMPANSPLPQSHRDRPDNDRD